VIIYIIIMTTPAVTNLNYTGSVMKVH